MGTNYYGGTAAGNIKAQRGIHSSNLLLLIFALIVAMNIPLFLGFQMLFVYGNDPADSFESAPILSQQVPFEQIYTLQKPSQVYAHLVEAGEGNARLLITEKHPWFDRWRTVENVTLGPGDNDFTTRVMCDVGFVNITVSNRCSITDFTITQTVFRFAGLDIPIIYIFILIAMLVVEIVAVVLLRKLRGH